MERTQITSLIFPILASILIGCQLNITQNNNIMTKKKSAQSEIKSAPIEQNEILQKGEQRHRMRVQFDISYGGTKGKKMNADSDTIPDLNLTVRQLLENHTRGKGNEVEVRQPLYMEFPIPNLKDITDVKIYQEQVQLQLSNINQFIKENDIDIATGKARPKPEKEKTPTEEILDQSLPEEEKK